MPTFMSEGIEIAYEVYGAGKPILLIHGFGSNGAVNWVATGWVDYLVKAGYAPITIDNRGHGESQKLYDSAYYSARDMAKDSSNLIKHLGLGAIPVMGYSMGARITTFLSIDHPEQVSAAILGGLGINILRGLGDADDIIQGLLAPTLEDVKTPMGRMFRRFGEHTKSDLRALAACMGGARVPISREALIGLNLPVLVAVGSTDEIGGDPVALANLLKNGQALVIDGRDHMQATGDKTFKSGALDFLSRLPT